MKDAEPAAIAAPFDKGAPVRQVVRPITGHVAGVEWDAGAKAFRYLVLYRDAADEQHHRWFAHAELERAS